VAGEDKPKEKEGEGKEDLKDLKEMAGDVTEG